MGTLREWLLQADEDYLIGLSNKGTVKRAGKDLEQETPQTEWQGDEAQVTLRAEVCRIRSPLGESTCTCPSRSICRHVVTAILWLKKECAGEAGGGKTEGETQEAEGRKAEETQEAEGSKAEEVQEAEGSKAGETQEARGNGKEGKAQEAGGSFLAVPALRLKRAAGTAGFRKFLAHIRAGETPSMEETSIVTVRFPWEETVVKLLEPMEYSSCSCQSRELCPHKAQALLWYQLSKKRLSMEELNAMDKTEALWDREHVREAAKAARRAILQQIDTGLSRQPPEAAESLERLAVICHKAGLPRLENGFREAASEYSRYFGRSAAFRSEGLLHKLLSLYRLAGKLETAEGQEITASLAGSFRDAYEPAGTLCLMGMGARTFSSKTGYEGEIYYFLEPKKNRWYTWTDARPTFYEGIRRRPPGASDSPAPWGLACGRDRLSGIEFRLTRAKAAAGGRLSASQETAGEILGPRRLKEAIRRQGFWDYRKLLTHFFSGTIKEEEMQKTGGRRERLALVGAFRWGEASFDRIGQRFSWSLFDEREQELIISVPYTKQDGLLISLLERIEKRLAKAAPKALLFFGAVYLEEGRLCLYPIECFLSEAEEVLEALEEIRDPQEETALQESENPQEETALQESEDPQEETALQEPENPQEEKDSQKLKHPQKKTAKQEEKIENERLSLAAAETMGQYVKEGLRLLADLFSCGLSSVPEEALAALHLLAQDGERLGLHRAGRELTHLEEALRGKRHQITCSPEPALSALECLERYFWLCRDKISYDQALYRLSEGGKAR